MFQLSSFYCNDPKTYDGLKILHAVGVQVGLIGFGVQPWDEFQRLL